MIEILHQQHEHKWWKEAVVYQIYPASFKDSNGDGVGDVPGIMSKLDYIRDLGVDVIWVCPHYKSPQVDMGYDIQDYEDIHEKYGTLEQTEELIKAVHDRGMRIIFDLVINHTSSLHCWFQESRSSKTNPKRDWYIWRPAKYDADGNRCRPNNWRSNFSKPAWTWDETSQEYYLHLYAPEQPDLNWENKECRRAIYQGAIKFWLDKGIDGFRIDTVNLYSKHPGLPDAPVVYPESESQPAMMYYANGPRMQEYLCEINDILANYDTMTVGELPYTPNEADVMAYISARNKQLNMVFNFDVVDLGQTPGARFIPRPFTTKDFKRELFKWQSVIENTDAWTTVFLENHDQGRSVSRFASDLPGFRVRAAKMLAVILATLTGTLFIYQGQEIGMINAPRSWSADEYKCIKSVSHLNEVREKSKSDPNALSEALDILQKTARDHARVPMQWKGQGANAGFCPDHVKPWMSVLESHEQINVEDQVGNKSSVLQFWKQIVRLRKVRKDVFVYGKFREIESKKADEDMVVFVKEGTDGTKSLTVANMSTQEKKWAPMAVLEDGRTFSLAIANVDDPGKDSLQPFEARVYVSAS
ncbi:glucan 1,6-alpha-glucosidase [Cladophialophora psammophila CBS 110553]|uniref:Glucan 1,6-alpha-glucosidase n=1 Tax=Cladophialophora psammophila CBS 110553 TaxID=1182543 RepID=W9X256_9EURO|nr:glucan 1,6-alpha-glucosidase [Cladophialophora psammophila CBS 110553]EXJ74557.1 glucan 1,6-alpha-glucosidase [Cladophialophora psammophila CBS 110553]